MNYRRRIGSKMYRIKKLTVLVISTLPFHFPFASSNSKLHLPPRLSLFSIHSSRHGLFILPSSLTTFHRLSHWSFPFFFLSVHSLPSSCFTCYHLFSLSSSQFIEIDLPFHPSPSDSSFPSMDFPRPMQRTCLVCNAKSVQFSYFLGFFKIIFKYLLYF